MIVANSVSKPSERLRALDTVGVSGSSFMIIIVATYVTRITIMVARIIHPILRADTIFPHKSTQ